MKDAKGRVVLDKASPTGVKMRPSTAADRRAWAKVRANYLDLASRFDRNSADERLASTAALYADLYSSGDQRPYDRLAEELGISVKSAKNRIYQAREKGLLTSEGQGRAGGQLTSKAREILDGAR